MVITASPVPPAGRLDEFTIQSGWRVIQCACIGPYGCQG